MRRTKNLRAAVRGSFADQTKRVVYGCTPWLIASEVAVRFRPTVPWTFIALKRGWQGAIPATLTKIRGCRLRLLRFTPKP